VKRPILDCVTKAYESIIANQHAEMRDHCRDFRTLHQAVYSCEACKALSAQDIALVACRVWARLEPAPFFDTDFAERYEALNKDFPLHECITGEPVVRKKEVLCGVSDNDLDRNRVFPKELINRLRVPRSLLISTPTGQDSWLRSEYATKEVLFPQPPKKVTTMNANKPYENISYVYGVAATTASDAHLIDSIKRVDTEINRLSDLKGTSKKVDAMVKSLEGDKAAIVAILDSRP